MKKGRFWAGLVLGIALVLSAEFLYLLIVEEKNMVIELIPRFYMIENKSHPSGNFIKPVAKDSLRYDQDSLLILAKNIKVDSAFYWEMWQRIISNPAYREMDSGWIDSLIKMEYVKLKIASQDTFHILQEKLIEREKVETPTLVLDVKSSQDTLVKIIKDPVRNATYLEFWQSPFNLTGYKYIPPILMLYGIQKNYVNKMFFFENGILLKISNQWVYVKPSPQFRNFDLPFQANWLNEIQ
ncbi:MAG: hypothetical protein N2Z72_07175 [Bacteroidales bacterium]|nr:hypothetical protein [Bacteroidales bacterium]